jgi:hypothetical protein
MLRWRTCGSGIPAVADVPCLPGVPAVDGVPSVADLPVFAGVPAVSEHPERKHGSTRVPGHAFLA